MAHTALLVTDVQKGLFARETPGLQGPPLRNLQGLPVDLRQGNIVPTPYESDFFDLVTCTGSVYLWDDRRAGLREIYRILVRGGSAHLFEPHADVTADERHRIREALRRETPLRRVIGPVLIGTAVGTPHGTTSQHSPYLVETEAL